MPQTIDFSLTEPTALPHLTRAYQSVFTLSTRKSGFEPLSMIFAYDGSVSAIYNYNKPPMILPMSMPKAVHFATIALLELREYRRLEQELESASIVDKLLPGYREKKKEAAKLAARFIGAAEEMERTQEKLNRLEQQRRNFEQWQTSPKTREMESLRDYLNTPEAKTRLREIKAQQLELERQQKPLREQGRGFHL